MICKHVKSCSAVILANLILIIGAAASSAETKSGRTIQPLPLAMALTSSNNVERQKQNQNERKKSVAIIGGGISGLTVGYTLQQSNRYDVQLFESNSILGGNIRSIEDPYYASVENDCQKLLNVGHATHLGMFLNLRLMLKHLDIPEKPVGRGSNDHPGLFRMISVDAQNGKTIQPPLSDITSPFIWWEAFLFYYDSYLRPEMSLNDFLNKREFSMAFLSILYWSMATFEFDKGVKTGECDEYALGVARALLITQVFFKYLLCDAFEGRLPFKIDDGLGDELKARATKKISVQSVNRIFRRLFSANDNKKGDDDGANANSLASYFTVDYTTAMEKLASGIGTVTKNTTIKSVTKGHSKNIHIETTQGDKLEVDYIVFTMQPSEITQVLCKEDFPQHVKALQNVDSGAVGVSIIHETDLPFQYPPKLDSQVLPFDMDNPSHILGIFDISELTIFKNKNGQRAHRDGGMEEKDKDKNENNRKSIAGWLSIAYPVYKDQSLNIHQQLLNKIPCADRTIYPWVKATSTYPQTRRKIVNLQGCNNIYITGHTLTGVNKASELQVVNALNLCHDYFGGISPPWGDYYPVPALPDCNDEDAFYKASNPLEAVYLSMKSLIGSFLLISVVSVLGADFFE